VTSSEKTSSKDKAHILESKSSLVLMERILSSSNSCHL
jgi:hypothetical protein